MVTALVTASGIACVAWTAFELLELSRVRPDAGAASRPFSRPHDNHRRTAPTGRSRRFAAWDDHGRPIDVEDLGTR